MIQDNDPVISQFISVPKELAGLNCAAFTAGVVEAILERAQFVRAERRPCTHLPNVRGAVPAGTRHSPHDRSAQPAVPHHHFCQV